MLMIFSKNVGSLKKSKCRFLESKRASVVVLSTLAPKREGAMLAAEKNQVSEI